MRKSIAILPILLFYYSFSQTTSLQYSLKISADSIRETVHLLASDSLEGRQSGKPGQKKAAAFISSKYRELKLNPGGSIFETDQPCILRNEYKYGYIQNHPLRFSSNKGRNLKISDLHSLQGDTEYLFGKDFIYPDYLRDSVFTFEELLFIGSGRKTEYSDIFNASKHTNKTLILLDSRDSLEQLASIFPLFSAELPAAVFIITTTDQIGDFLMRGFNMNLNKAFPIIFISGEIAAKLFPPNEFMKIAGKIRNTEKTYKRKIATQITLGLAKNTEELRGQNIIAYLRGENNDSEVVIISAHYDHLGIRDSLTYYGADDNASGTAAVLEIARIFSAAATDGYKPRRSILFLNVSGEEIGLLGSAWYVNHPALPLSKTIADLNIDMIGRCDNYHDSINSPNYIYIIGSQKMSSDLHSINEACNISGPGLELNYSLDTPDEPNRLYSRSDHYNFVKKGIPAIFYFDGLHKDYHKPTDSADKIDYEMLVQRCRLVFLTAWELANRKDRIVIDKEDEIGK